MSRPRGGARVCVAGWLIAAAVASTGAADTARDTAASRQPFDPTVSASLIPVPEPLLDGMEESIRRQLERQRGELDAILASDEADPTLVAEAFGTLGQSYLLHELDRPAEACLENAGVLAPEDFRWPYYLGYLHQRRGELEPAAEALRRALSLRPDDPAALLRLGQVELAVEDLGQAAARLRRAAELPPVAAAAHAGLARLAETRRDDAAAIVHFKAALELQPEASQLRYPLALAYRRSGEIDRARRQLELRGDRPVEHADPLVEHLASLSAGASLEIVAAGRALAGGRVQEAVGHYRAAVSKDPANPTARRGLGEALARAGDAGGAIEQYREALRLAPEDAVARYDLGTLLLESGRLDEAIQLLASAAESSPDFAAAHFNLATAMARSGRVEEAARGFRRAFELEPENLEARRQLGVALAQLERYDEAAEALGGVVAADPSDLPSRYFLGTALGALGRDAEARAALERALADADDRPALAARLEIALARLDPPGSDRALGRIERAQALAPGLPEVSGARAEQLLAAGRCAEARSDLETAVARWPEQGDLLHLLARLLATCDSAASRDGRRALTLAERVYRALPSFEHAETVAMALAELGRFEEAAALQRQLVETAEANGEGSRAKVARRRLGLYEARRPCRSPWITATDAANGGADGPAR